MVSTPAARETSRAQDDTFGRMSRSSPQMSRSMRRRDGGDGHQGAAALHPTVAGWPERPRDVEEACGRPSSLRIVWACVRYAASVRYQRVTLDDLSAAASVSERRVRDAFSDCHGMSPTAFLRVAALLEVRRALLAAPTVRDAVTRAASDYGFWHLGRFAGQYRALFGESPSTTLARARAGAESGRGSTTGPTRGAQGRATVLDRYEGRPPAEPQVPLSRTLPCHSLRRVAPYESRIGG